MSEPDPPPAGTTYERFRSAELFLRAGQPREAAQLAAEVLEDAPESTAALELRARALFASAQLGRAEEALRALVERRPDDGWARFALARTLERTGRADEAAEQRRVAAALGFQEPDGSEPPDQPPNASV